MALYVEPRDIRHFEKLVEPISGEELFWLDELGPGELVKGVFVPMPPPGYEHGETVINIGSLFKEATRTEGGHAMGGEIGVFTERNPDTVRGLDVAWISDERFAKITSKSYLDVMPELVVEVMSPSNRWTEMQDKIDEYFAAGAQLVWIVYPKRQQVYVFESAEKYTRLSAEDQLTGGTGAPPIQR